MRSVHLKAASLALMFLLAATAATAGIEMRNVSEQNGRVVVQLNNDYTVPPFITSFYVAISSSGSYSVSFVSGPFLKTGGALQAAALVDTVTLFQPFPFRGARVLHVKVTIPINTPVSHVIVDYTPAASFATAATADPLVKELVINESVFPQQATTGAPAGWFSRAAGWAKFSVNQRGVYLVTGADLAGENIDIADIDPETLRLYTHGGLIQPRLLNDPDGSFLPDNAMREVAIRVEAGVDGNLEPGDRILFYGIGGQDWADYYDVSQPDSVFHEHTHARTNYYYLAWGSSLPGAPLRMADADATPAAASDRTSYTHREYRERDLIAEFDFRGDGWLWLDVPAPAPGRLYDLGTVNASQVVTSVPQQFHSIGLAPFDSAHTSHGHHAAFRYRVGATTVPLGGWVWDTQPGERFYENGVPIRISGNNFVRNGTNQYYLEVPGDLQSKDKMLFAWYAVWYERRIVATSDAVGFSTPDTTGAMNLLARGFGTTGNMFAFDVTDPWSPSRLTGVEVNTAGSERTSRVGVNLAGQRRHLWVAAGSGLMKPGIARITPVDLRVEAASPHMLIVSHRDMQGSAERLRSHRAAGRVPLITNPVVKVVTVDEIYDNFSGGMPDPIAIRNYVKYLFDNFPDANGNPRLTYVLLLGDATEDFQNHASAQRDFVPLNLYFTHLTPYAFGTDEWFGHLDTGDQSPGHGILDVAIGRLPAASADEAAFLVDRVIAYETEAPYSDWRNRVILVADDEKSSCEACCEFDWTFQSEGITLKRAPDFLSIGKIYLTEYPEIAGVKPTSRFAFLEAWNAGALVNNYIGHGSSVQMADEQVFLGADVSQLVNGLKLPLTTAFSCTIGDFGNPAGKCLSEKLLLREGGGSIAAITASRETFGGPNERVCFALFERLFPRRPGRTQLPLGVALMQSKLQAQLENMWTSFTEENSWKYNLLGDPAMRLAIAKQEIRFDAQAPDTMVAGVRRTLAGAVYSNGAIDTSFDGPVSVIVREPQVRRRYIMDCLGNPPINYLLPGGPIYQGTVDAVDGRFEVSFRVPRFAATGTLAFAGAYGNDGTRDAAASVDSVLVVVPPTLADSLDLVPVDGAPRVSLGFKSGLTVVKPGDTVRAQVNDADGINILNTTNEGRQAILIDNLPVPLDVNEFFAFEHGGTDTSGVLLFPLPDLKTGSHRLVYKVSDSFGFTTLDTLHFSVTDAGNYYAEAAFNYPNPFKDKTQFLFRLSNRAAIKLELYTVSGKFVRRIEEVREGGEIWMEWDGRDGFGGDVANGSYLYVATFDFVGVDRPPVVVRGRLSRIR